MSDNIPRHGHVAVSCTTAGLGLYRCVVNRAVRKLLQKKKYRKALGIAEVRVSSATTSQGPGWGPNTALHVVR